MECDRLERPIIMVFSRSPSPQEFPSTSRQDLRGSTLLRTVFQKAETTWHISLIEDRAPCNATLLIAFLQTDSLLAPAPLTDQIYQAFLPKALQIVACTTEGVEVQTRYQPAFYPDPMQQQWFQEEVARLSAALTPQKC